MVRILAESDEVTDALFAMIYSILHMWLFIDISSEFVKCVLYKQLLYYILNEPE